jgi:hypothetical protein
MPDAEYTPPQFVLTDADTVSVIKESLDRAILTRQKILANPKPSYNIDGQEFKWAEYLLALNKTITQLQTDLQAFDDPFELDSVAYS